MTFGFRIIQIILRFVTFFCFRVKIQGIENVPAEGGLIMAVNHKSYWDPVVVGMSTPRKLRYMAKAELFRNKLFGKLISALGAFPVQRGKGDIGAIKGALSILKREEPLLIFPEGGRTKDEKTSTAKPGAVMLAVRAEVPVVPVYISGKYRWFGTITVRYGTPVFYRDYYGQKLVVEQLQELSNDLLKTMRTYRVEGKKHEKQRN
ncbi:MAG: 1-acyl-sn-glycerol-3-phosphate acyltransferase [Ruminococcaceae bacterium]|nr:1-acyl-sn-glycerol-3-phosphate acyltransferase [Oscillospiraceae bacterium]